MGLVFPKIKKWRHKPGFALGVLFFCLGLSAWAQGTKPPPPLPQGISDWDLQEGGPAVQTLERSSDQSIDEIVTGMSITANYPSDQPEYVETGLDVIDFTIRLYRQLAARAGPFAWIKEHPEAKIEVFEVRYGFGSERVSKVIQEVLDSGSVHALTVIEDLNQVFQYAGEADKEISWAFSRSKYGQGGAAVATRYLLEQAGFKIGGDGPRAVFGPGVYNQKLVESLGRFVPLFHMKRTIVKVTVPGKKPWILVADSTGNFSEHGKQEPASAVQVTRLNRTTVIVEENFGEHTLEHVQKLIEGFKARKEVKDMALSPVMRLYFKEGMLETAHTDGVLDVNLRISNGLRILGAKPEFFEVGEIGASQFVFTDRETFYAIKELKLLAKKLGRKLPVYFYGDSRQASDVGWDLTPALDGHIVTPTQGTFGLGFS